MTAFSTASAPELTSIDRFSKPPGVSRLSRSHTSTYPSYGVIMKQVWVNRAACSATAATTAGAALPTEVDRDARAEVDQRVAVHVDEHAAAGPLDEDRQRGAHAGRDGRGAPGHQLLRLRAGDRGDEPAALRGDVGAGPVGTGEGLHHGAPLG